MTIRDCNCDVMQGNCNYGGGSGHECGKVKVGELERNLRHFTATAHSTSINSPFNVKYLPELQFGSV